MKLKQNKRCTVTIGIIMIAIIIIAGTVWAAIVVSSDPVRKPAPRNADVSFPLKLNSDQSVAGINGVMRYDPLYLSQPRVEPAAGASGFTVVGNETQLGRFRFAAYRSPSTSLDLSKPALTFALRTAVVLPPGNTTKITYFTSAAAKPDGTSFGADVAFADVVLDLQSGAQSWVFY